MLKLYKYRPLSEFLFKELFYQELFFASYIELNDPFDLSARMDFSIENEDQLEALMFMLFKTTLILHEEDYTDVERLNNQGLLAFNDNDTERNDFKTNLFKSLSEISHPGTVVTLDEVINQISNVSSSRPMGFNFDINKFITEINRITQKFLQNSYTTCFSEDPANFLMWSHYASRHTGICLEFTLNHGKFPYEKEGKRRITEGAYENGFCKGIKEVFLFEDRIRAVDYKDVQPHINFFEFAPVFQNEYDCDLIGLSKSKWHPYAYQLENVFATKTLPWSYEKEWRAISINLDLPQEPEQRIKHYPIESLTGIFFGTRTPEQAKNRIAKIYKEKRHDLTYSSCKLSNGRELDFEPWEFFED
ncbi:MAG: DUF2971 domain-containing protein [Bacteroidota bacterium]